MTEPLMLTVAQVRTYANGGQLTGASGFFFERDGRLYLVTSRHVLSDPASGHFPDEIRFDVHVDATDLTRFETLAVALYHDGRAAWRQAVDTGGEVDVAALPLDRTVLPAVFAPPAFTPAHLLAELESVEVGDALLVAGYPLGFHDTVHHLPVVRHAIVASSFGIRFQGRGFFLTDARTHRGTSGAPVVTRALPKDDRLGRLQWKLTGVHSGQLEMQPRDAANDEALGLNCAWYADVLLALTEPLRAV